MLNAKTLPIVEMLPIADGAIHFTAFAHPALSAGLDKHETSISSQTTVEPARLTGWIRDVCRNSVSQDAAKISGRASRLFSQIVKLSGVGNSKKEFGRWAKRSPPSKAGRNVNGPPWATAAFSARGAIIMKNSMKDGTTRVVSCLIRNSHPGPSLCNPLLKRLLLLTPLTCTLALVSVGAVQAWDASPESRSMRPLYAVSFDVGRKHVMSYFLKKDGQCNLTMMVTDRPTEPPEGDEITPLATSRFEAEINGGKSARFDTAEGRTLEYACSTGAKAMVVRQVNQVANTAPSAN